ncbi:MAG: WG repeat-containing protein [Clostridia bacterium]|nr:WG repeat-containing protein [Clostridia bacterium]
MKKKLLIVLALIAVLLSLSAFAETGIFPLEKIGDYRKFATCYERIPPPRGPVIDMYYNFGIMDMDGNVVVEPIYEGISDFKDGRSLFKIGGKYGFFDENWNVVIEPKYKGAADFSEGLACVCDDNWSYGFIDVNGNTILPHTFDYAESFQDGLAVIGKVDEGYNHNIFIRTGKFDREGRQIEPVSYNWEKNYGLEYDVQMSANNININGSVYENDELEYPFINYLGYTYIPMSFYTCFHLGFATTWNPVDGLGITPPGSVPMIGGENHKFANILGENDMVPGKMFKAQLYKGSITIAGETYTADDVYYPLLTYRDIVYIPVLWRQGMEGMGLEYTYDLESKSLVFKPKK